MDERERTEVDDALQILKDLTASRYTLSREKRAVAIIEWYLESLHNNLGEDVWCTTPEDEQLGT